MRTFEYALDELARNGDLLINGRFLNFQTRRSASTSIDQLLYFIKRHVTYFLQAVWQSTFPDKLCEFIHKFRTALQLCLCFKLIKKVLLNKETFLVLKILENVFSYFKQQFQYTPFFYKQSVFDPCPKNCLSFSKKLP